MDNYIFPKVSIKFSSKVFSTISRLYLINFECFRFLLFYNIFSDVKSDITAIRKQNPRLRVVASLGGQAMKGSLFSSLITENESFSNLTSSISDFHKKDVIDGLEIDWEWPVRDGGKKDRMKLIRYARVSNCHYNRNFHEHTNF